MKKWLLKTCVLLIILTSCIQENPSRNDKNLGRASKIQGLTVFIYSDPVADYEVLDVDRHKFTTEILEAGKDKTGWDTAESIGRQIVQNLQFREQVNKRVQSVKKNYPEADALIIRDKVFEAEVIRFN